jgi:Superfamily II DNA/RNA helicases, SNF2 family
MIRAAVVENKIHIFDAYDIKEELKQLPGRRYNADAKVWELPLNEFSVKSLRSLGLLVQGYEAPASKAKILAEAKPIVRPRINGKLYDHQIRAFNFSLETYRRGQGVALLMDMGTGKTITAIAIAGTLYASNLIKRLLVVSPLSITGVWKSEFCKFADYNYILKVLDGSVKQKAEDLAKRSDAEALQIAVVNYESAWRMEEEIRAWAPEMIICDESTKIKNHAAKASKSLHKLAMSAKYRMILTGTPVTNSPIDLFSQYKFLDTGIFGSSFYAFRSRYAVLGGYGNHQIVRYVNLDDLTQRARSIAYRVRLADAVELPDKIDEIVPVELEPRALKIYKNIEAQSYAELAADAAAADAAGGVITTRNVLTKLLRFSQITGGFIRADGVDNERATQLSNSKLAALEDIIDRCLEQGEKIVIFVRFIAEIKAINALLETKKVKYSCVYGEVKDRDTQVKAFQENAEIKAFIGQLATTSMGLTLTAAHVAVFYSLDFNFANYEQSRARIHRIGQTQKCVYYHLVAKDTVDERIMDALKTKGDVAQMIVDDYKTTLKDVERKFKSGK